MAKIQFTGLRNLGNLYGILAQRSVPTELNIEDGVSIVAEAGETISQELTIYQMHRQLQAHVGVGTITSTDILSGIAFPENAYIVGISFEQNDAADFGSVSIEMSDSSGLFAEVFRIAVADKVTFQGGVDMSSSWPGKLMVPLPWMLRDRYVSAGSGGGPPWIPRVQMVSTSVTAGTINIRAQIITHSAPTGVRVHGT